MTRVTGAWLMEPSTQAVIQALEAAGYDTFFVGGCVRNAMLGVPVSDVDISTAARPEAVMQHAEAAGFSAHPTGIEHGTVTVATGAVTLEITSFRRDVETDGRRAVVTFSDTIEEDAVRRDFTMNALYARRDGTVVDPLQGLADLQARRVRFIEDPEQRIREDYLRILRFFRFHAHYGDQDAGLDAEGLAACASLSEGLVQLSRERVGAEMLKLLAAADPAAAVASMERAGCLSHVLPGATSEYLSPLVHLEAGIHPDPIRRLAAMNAKDAGKLLRLSRAQARDHQAIRAALLTTIAPAELAYRLGYKRARDVVLIRHASSSQTLPETLEQDLLAGSKATFPVKAPDLPEYTGKALGDWLRTLEDRWIASGFTASKKELLGDTR